jgi:glutamate formiminotransferase / formiminotetrahydrofolate cyclodeaminase
MSQQLIECVPNFSEGRDEAVIDAIAREVKNTPGVKLLNVDPGKATNRTVVTFAGAPEDVIEAAFRAIKKASELIDMRKHHGEHPRMGATDVCPLIPLANISMEETVAFAKKLAKRVSEELHIPTYLYEYAASNEERRNLSVIREGEYEGLEKKLSDPNWKPDYGDGVFNAKSGATVIGARDFLIAYNINLNSTSTRIANAIAFDVREQGRVKRIGHPVLGELVLNEKGETVRIPGTLKSVKAIGWYIEEYRIAQISMNLTNINITSVHAAFDEVVNKASERGVRVTGSEIVGMIPKSVLIDAGKYFLAKQKRSIGVPEEELIQIAILSLGLNDISKFKPEERIIEYMLEEGSHNPLNKLTIREFANLASSESPAPGGGSIAAYVGAIGISLGAMVSNLSAAKRGWEDRTEYFSDMAYRAQVLKEELLNLVDEDTRAFTKVMDAFAMPKTTDAETAARKKAIADANLYATQVPLKVMETAFKAFDIIKPMCMEGNPNSITDGGVGGLCVRTALEGAYFNIKTNLPGIKNEEIKNSILQKAEALMAEGIKKEAEIKDIVNQKLNKA